MSTGAARLEQDWSGQLGMPYHQFLQAKQFEGSFRASVRDHQLALIGNVSELAAVGYRVIEREHDKDRAVIEAEFAALRRTVDARLDLVRSAVVDSAMKLEATLEWGFGGTLLQLGRVNETLESLLDAVRSPSATASLEQFRRAADQFERGLHSNALASVTRAIQGWGDIPPYDDEATLHFLVGAIHLGGYQNVDPTIVKPAKAEDAFLTAAKYARSRLEEAAAFTAAGRAALVQEEYGRAVSHAERALERLPREPSAGPDGMGADHLPALLIAAKAHAGLENWALMEGRLTTALFINPRLSLEVVRDLDFSSDEADEAVQRALRNATGYWRRGREIVLQKFDKALKTFRALRSTSGIEPSSLVAPAFNALLAEYQRLALPSDRLLENVAAYHYIKSLRGRVCALPDQARHELSSGKNYDLRSAEGDVVGDGAAYIYLGAGLLTVLCAFLAAPTGGFMGVLGAIVIVGFISFVVATITVLGMEAGIKSERRAEAERFRRDCAEISRLSNVVLWE